MTSGFCCDVDTGVVEFPVEPPVLVPVLPQPTSAAAVTAVMPSASPVFDHLLIIQTSPFDYVQIIEQYSPWLPAIDFEKSYCTEIVLFSRMSAHSQVVEVRLNSAPPPFMNSFSSSQ